MYLAQLLCLLEDCGFVPSFAMLIAAARPPRPAPTMATWNCGAIYRIRLGRLSIQV
jgi:hypothetical protein